MSVRRSFLRVCIPFFVLVASLGLPHSSLGLEAFSFVAQKNLPIKDPAGISKRGEAGWAVYDSSARALVLLDQEFKKQGAIDLRKTLGKSFGEITVLRYNTLLDRMFALDGSRKVVHVFKTDGSHDRTIDLNITRPVANSSLTTLAIDARGRVYVGDVGRGDIKAYTLQGQFLFNITRPADSEGKVAPIKSTGLVVFKDGSLGALIPSENSLLTFDRSGALLKTVTFKKSFATMKRVIATDAGELVCFDVKQQKVLKWKRNGFVLMP